MANPNPARRKDARDAAAAMRYVAGADDDAVENADRLIHERIRLAIVSALAVNESLTFTELKDLLDTTDGNLSVHARKLEDARYITCKKTFEGRTPKTTYQITDMGRRAIEKYLSHMEALIKAVNKR